MNDEARLVTSRARGASALAFHVLYDTAATKLRELRLRRTAPADDPAVPDGRIRLVAQPYLVTTPDAGWDRWSEPRRWRRLLDRVDALLATDEQGEGRRIPRSQIHDLRAGLFLGRVAADARLALVGGQGYSGLETLTFEDLDQGVRSLFYDDTPHSTASVLLDAMDAEVFLLPPRVWRDPDDPEAARQAGLDTEGAR
jgi:hypothetical protein